MIVVAHKVCYGLTNFCDIVVCCCLKVFDGFVFDLLL